MAEEIRWWRALGKAAPGRLDDLAHCWPRDHGGDADLGRVLSDNCTFFDKKMQHRNALVKFVALPKVSIRGDLADRFGVAVSTIVVQL